MNRRYVDLTSVAGDQGQKKRATHRWEVCTHACHPTSIPKGSSGERLLLSRHTAGGAVRRRKWCGDLKVGSQGRSWRNGSFGRETEPCASMIIRRSAEKSQTIGDEILMNPRKKGTSPFFSRRNPGPFNLEGTGKGGCPLFSKSPALDRIRPRAGRNNNGDVLLDVAELGVRAAGAAQAFRIRRRIPRPAIPRPAAARAIVEGSGTTAAVPGEPMLVTVKGAGTGVTD